VGNAKYGSKEPIGHSKVEVMSKIVFIIKTSATNFIVDQILSNEMGVNRQPVYTH
jgi:hypothetical protein